MKNFEVTASTLGCFHLKALSFITFVTIAAGLVAAAQDTPQQISPGAATPTFSPVAGTYGSAQAVTIRTTTPSATIHYTTNGRTPTTSSAVYSSPLTVSGTETVEAIAIAGSLVQSPVGSVAYTIGSMTAAACSGISLGTNSNLNGFLPFGSASAWNTNIVSAPVDPTSEAIVGSSEFAGLHLHPDFGAYGGIPYIVVDSTVTPSVAIHVSYSPGESDIVVAPYPINTPIEGSLADCSAWPGIYQGDAHALVLDRAKCQLYETFNTNRCNGLLNANSQTLWNLQGDESRPWGSTSADAAGLSIFAGLLRYDEIASGAIHHAIRYTMKSTKSNKHGGYFVPPASHASGNNRESSNVEGMRIRLKPTFDMSGFSQVNQIILTAMQQYGMILADNGGSFFFQGAQDLRFNDDDLNRLKTIASSDFEVVQASVPLPGYDAVTAPTGVAPTINSFTASASSVSSGSPLTFTYSVSNDSYDYIDMVGPVTGGSVTITPTATQTYKLYAKNAHGQAVSRAVTVTVSGSVIVPTTFTPAAGRYRLAQKVTLNTTTYPWATIYYTIDGSVPTTNSTVYTGPLTVAATQTLRAIAIAPGYSSPSAVSKAVYILP